MLCTDIVIIIYRDVRYPTYNLIIIFNSYPGSNIPKEV